MQDASLYLSGIMRQVFLFVLQKQALKVQKSSAAIPKNWMPAFANDIKTAVVDNSPPYADNVNYSELADFFYVWLRLILAKTYPQFAPAITPKSEEIIENPTRGKTSEDYEKGLTEVWRRSYESLEDDGLMVFTFHLQAKQAISYDLIHVCK